MIRRSIDGKTVLGLVEIVDVYKDGKKVASVPARIDTGATKSSIDVKMASELRLGPIVESKMIKSANGARLRPVVEASILIEGRKIKAKFSMADRSHMRFKMLIGQNILKQGFLIDPSIDGADNGN